MSLTRRLADRSGSFENLGRKPSRELRSTARRRRFHDFGAGWLWTRFFFRFRSRLYRKLSSSIQRYGTQSASSLTSTTDPVEAKHTMIDYMIIRYRQKVSLAPVDPRLTSHFTASAPESKSERVTSRVVRLRRACSSDLRARPGTAGSGWASRDRQRTMYVDTSPADCRSHSKVCLLYTSPSPRD